MQTLDSKSLERSNEIYDVLAGGVQVESDPVAGADLTTHANLSTSAHGGIVASGDSRLSDARTPLGHVHAAGDVTSGQFAMARLASGVADGTKFIRDDGTLQTAGGGNHAASHQNGGGDEVSVAGLSGLLADGQTPLAHAHVAADITGTAVLTADSRLSDARTPTAHNTSHQNGGGDEISVAGLSGALADPQPPIIGGGAAQAVAGNDSRLTDARTPTAHSHVAADITGTAVLTADARLSDARTPTGHDGSHESGGLDQIDVTDLSGVLADPQHPIIGSGATEAVAGNDSRLTDARTPLEHSSSHSNASSDPVSVINLAGFPGGTATFLRADATFAAPPGGGGDIAMTLIAPAVDETVTAGYSGYVSDYYEIASTKFLEIGDNAVFEVG